MCKNLTTKFTEIEQKEMLFSFRNTITNTSTLVQCSTGRNSQFFGKEAFNPLFSKKEPRTVR